MKRRTVRLSEQAEADLEQIDISISDRAGGPAGRAFLVRLRTYCLGLEIGAERGTRRDDLFAGLRTVGFEKRVLIAFQVTDDTVTVMRLFYGGQNWESTLAGLND